jgi:hypothetical protein
VVIVGRLGLVGFLQMTRIVIPDKTPEHQACETALHVACDRIMHAEQEARTWRIIAILATLVSLLALAGRMI